MSQHFTEAWRAVATAKIDEFAYQCERLGALARAGEVDRAGAAGVLADIAEAHALDIKVGADRVASMIAEAFAPPAEAEAAE